MLRIITHVFFLFSAFNLTCAAPIITDSPDAVPVQQLDYVYLPKEVIESLLPHRTRREIRVEACEVASLFNLPCPDDYKIQLQLIETYKKYRKMQSDPDGRKRIELQRQLAELNTQLNQIINERRIFLLNLKTAERNFRGCHAHQISDARKAECDALSDQIQPQQRKLAELSSQELEIMKIITATKQRQNSLVL